MHATCCADHAATGGCAPASCSSSTSIFLRLSSNLRATSGWTPGMRPLSYSLVGAVVKSSPLWSSASLRFSSNFCCNACLSGVGIPGASRGKATARGDLGDLGEPQRTAPDAFCDTPADVATEEAALWLISLPGLVLDDDQSVRGLTRPPRADASASDVTASRSALASEGGAAMGGKFNATSEHFASGGTYGAEADEAAAVRESVAQSISHTSSSSHSPSSSREWLAISLTPWRDVSKVSAGRNSGDSWMPADISILAGASPGSCAGVVVVAAMEPASEARRSRSWMCSACSPSTCCCASKASCNFRRASSRSRSSISRASCSSFQATCLASS
mmetsp:Transcript_25726/g.74307  ORF Transcript_25726/g.74307 Transcript_25726/m.74307 type:complete len:333 (-) Transcript_25726:415-1413(-)